MREEIYVSCFGFGTFSVPSCGGLCVIQMQIMRDLYIAHLVGIVVSAFLSLDKT